MSKVEMLFARHLADPIDLSESHGTSLMVTDGVYICPALQVMYDSYATFLAVTQL